MKTSPVYSLRRLGRLLPSLLLLSAAPSGLRAQWEPPPPPPPGRVGGIIPTSPPAERFTFENLAHFGAPGCPIYGVMGALVEGPGGRLYGTASGEGAPAGVDKGVVFGINLDGTGCVILHTFAGRSGGDGAKPNAGLVYGLGGYLYGTTSEEGPVPAAGTVFRIRPEAGAPDYGYEIIHRFIQSEGDGVNPYGKLLPAPGAGEDVFYGTTRHGGMSGGGVAFRLARNPDGSWDYRKLRDFPHPGTTGVGDLYAPVAGLVDGGDGRLYGTASSSGERDTAGRYKAGGIYRIQADDETYRPVYVSDSTPGSVGGLSAGLLRASDGAFYSFSTQSWPLPGDSYSYGALFRTAFVGGAWQTRIIHNVNGEIGRGDLHGPGDDMRLLEGPDGRLYGTAGESFDGTAQGGVFVCRRDAGGDRGDFKPAVRFLNREPVPGRVPMAGLLAASSGWFYGTTSQGGDNGGGTLFRMRPNDLAFGVQVDIASVTQGADYDASTPGAPPVAYSRVKRKDTLVRVQPYTVGPVSPITSAALRVQKTGELTQRTFPTDTALPSTAPIAGRPAGVFSGAPSVDFWLPADTFPTSGSYRFTLLLTLAGSAVTHEVPLVRGGLGGEVMGLFFGTPGNHLSTLLFPGSSRLISPPAANSMRWTTEHQRMVLNTLSELGRLLPVRTGLRRFAPVAGEPEILEGLRYRIAPGVFDTARVGENHEEWQARFHRYMAEAVALENVALARRGIAERFDLAIGLEAAQTNRVASFQRIRDGRAGVIVSEFGSLSQGTAPSLLLRQVARCFGVADSPATGLVLPSGRTMANLGTRTEVLNPQFVLNNNASLIPSPLAVLPGGAWNDLRLALLNLHPASRTVATADGPGSPASFLHFSGIMVRGGTVLEAASLQTDAPLGPLSEPATGSPWQLVLVGAGDTPLTTLPFAPGFDEDGFAVTLLDVELPAGATGARVLYDGSAVWNQPFSTQPPVIGGVVLEELGEGRRKASWSASDGDSQELTFSLLVRAAGDEAPRLLATGIREPQLEFDASMLPAGPAVLTVEATDGFNVGSADSAPFTVARTAPSVAIAPVPEHGLLSSRPLTFQGLAYDPTDGILPGDALEWFEGERPLGVGSRLEQVFAPGIHTLRLRAMNAGGLSASDEVTFQVSADSDADGLPDDYEPQHGLVVGQPDGNSDADADGLTALREFLAGTDPTKADSDGDGFPDAEELAFATHPSDAVSHPLTEDLRLSVEQLDFGVCPVTAKSLTVTTATPATAWSTRTTIPGLTLEPASGSGGTTVQFTLDCAGMEPGSYAGVVWFTASGGRPQPVTVTASVAGGEPPLPAVMLGTLPDLTFECDGTGFATASFTPAVTLTSGYAALIENDPPSGSRFPLGKTTVVVTATSVLETQQSSFQVTVLPAAPALAVEAEAGSLVFRWSVACGEATLESASQLSVAGAWKPVTFVPERNGNQVSLRWPLPADVGQQFFRLRLR